MYNTQVISNQYAIQIYTNNDKNYPKMYRMD